MKGLFVRTERFLLARFRRRRSSIIATPSVADCYLTQQLSPIQPAPPLVVLTMQPATQDPKFILIILRQVLFAAAFLFMSLAVDSTKADGPGDNDPSSVRPVPPVGDVLDDETAKSLLNEVDRLRKLVAAAVTSDGQSGGEWYPDVMVLIRAVELAVQQKTFYNERDIKLAAQHLQLAEQRLESVRSGLRGIELLKAHVKPKDGHWMLVGGFESKIDATVQPFGLIVPLELEESLSNPQRLDVWLHGRGERELELQFLSVRQNNKGYYAPSNAITLHPYGRYSNAFKFAGEVDVFEAIEHVNSILKVDQQRISIRGFSMGGAGCWQMAVHFPGYWMAATPGAGFAETREFLRVFQGEQWAPDGPMEKLLNWYDCPPWVTNLRNLPTVAYSGELDRQKQAADIMVTAAEKAGMEFPHVIGPQTEHKIHPDAVKTISDQMDEWSEAGKPLVRKHIDFTTYTLEYPNCGWIRIDGMRQHWSPARVVGDLTEDGSIKISTHDVTHLSLHFDAAQLKSIVLSGMLNIDGVSASIEVPANGQAWDAYFVKRDGEWLKLDRADLSLRKRPGLQGPIDDAFMSSFVMVTPSRPCTHGAVQRWVASEMNHFKTEWRRQFRGDVREISDEALDAETIKNNNLILFGDPASNRVLAKIIDRLPLKWTRDALEIQGKSYPVESTAAVMVYPNPLNSSRYIVINSGFTYRQYAYLNNARQVPHLPDWAVLDVMNGSDARMPGKILESGFFDENWK